MLLNDGEKMFCDLYIDCGRMGAVTGSFWATPDELDKLLGKRVEFGEALGKHSDIGGVIEEGEITYKNIPADVVAKLAELKIDITSGHNPIEYVACSKCGSCEADFAEAVVGKDLLCHECLEEENESV